MLRLIDMFLGGKLVPIGVGLVALFVAFLVWKTDRELLRRSERAAGEQVGVRKQQEATKQANEKVIKKAADVRRRVRRNAGRVRSGGVVDPNY